MTTTENIATVLGSFPQHFGVGNIHCATICVLLEINKYMHTLKYDTPRT